MLLQYEDVRMWLLEQAPNATCGERKSAVSCPLAQYLHARTGVRYSVSDHYGPCEATYPDRPDEPLPRWAADFVGLVDCGAAYTLVTVAEALADLELIRSQQEEPDAE